MMLLDGPLQGFEFEASLDDMSRPVSFAPTGEPRHHYAWSDSGKGFTWRGTDYGDSAEADPDCQVTTALLYLMNDLPLPNALKELGHILVGHYLVMGHKTPLKPLVLFHDETRLAIGASREDALDALDCMYTSDVVRDQFFVWVALCNGARLDPKALLTECITRELEEW